MKTIGVDSANSQSSHEIAKFAVDSALFVCSRRI
jgi:hypothetical protein